MRGFVRARRIDRSTLASTTVPTAAGVTPVTGMTDADTGTDDGPSSYSQPARNPSRSSARPILAVAARSATTLREHPLEANLGRPARVNVDDVSFREECRDIPSREALRRVCLGCCRTELV